MTDINEDHRLTRLDFPDPSLNFGSARRAHCLCGSNAWVLNGWDGAKMWMRLHREAPALWPALLAQVARGSKLSMGR